MKAGLDIKISKYTLWALLAIVIVGLAMFFFVGFGEEVVTLKKIEPSEAVDEVSKKIVEEKCPFVKFDKNGQIASVGYSDGELVPKEYADSIIVVDNSSKVFNAEFEIAPDKSLKSLRSPEHTDTLIYLMYILTIVPIVIIVIYAIWNLALMIIDNPSKALKSLIPLLLFIALVGVCYACAGTDPVIVNEKLYEDSFWLKVTSAFLLIQYVLLVLCIVLTIVSITGVVKFVNNVKKTTKES